ncbi:MAG: hypothetical protein IKH36_01960 [Bacilli bacterium]|nr:hypothetical protein [Bacilli bacterium]
MSNFVRILYPNKIKTLKNVRLDKSVIRSYRIYKKQYIYILQACMKLGISPNYFIKWCALNMAYYINEGKINKDIELINKDL